MRWTIFGSILLGSLVFDLPWLSSRAYSDQPKETQGRAPTDHHAQDRYGDPLPAFAVTRLGTLRLKQEEKIDSIAFAPDGRTIASVNGEQVVGRSEVRVWSVTDGRLVCRLRVSDDVALQDDPWFRCQPSEGSVPEFAPDGNALALLCVTKVLMWDLDKRRPTRVWGEKNRYVNGCAFSPDGKLLAWGSVVPGPSGPLENMIEVYDAVTGKPARKIATPAKVKKLCGSPKDNFVAAVLEDHTVGIWDIAKGTQVQLLKDPGETIHLVAFSPDGKTIATGSENRYLSIWSVASGKRLHDISSAVTGDSMLDMAFVPPGRYLAALGQGYVSVWNATTGDRVDQVEIPGWCRRIAFSPDGKLLAWPSGCAVVLRRFPDNTDPLGIQGHTDMVPFVAFLSDGVLVSWGRDCKTLLWNVAAAKPIWELSNGDYYVPVAFGPQAVAVSRQQELLAIAFRGRAVEIWNTVERKREKTLPVAEKQLLSALQFSPDCNSLACGDLDGNLVIFELQSGHTIRKWTKDEWLPKNKNGERSTEALPWGGNNTISMSVARDGMEIQSLAWSADGRIVVSATPRKARWLDVRTGKVVRESSGSSEEVSQRYVTFSPNGKLLAALEGTTNCVVVEVASGRELWNDKDDKSAFSGSMIAFSPDSSLIAGGCGDSIRLVDASTGKERATVATDQGDVEGIGFSADGRFLAAGGRNGAILVFDMAKVLATERDKPIDAEHPSPDVKDAPQFEQRRSARR